jgi:hypothetical protein
MKKVKSRAANDDMRPEYDFTGAVRGKYYERFRQSSNVVLLDPDVSEVFPNAESVNQALRALASAARKGRRVIRRPSSPQRRPNNAADEVREGKAARPSQLIRGVSPTPGGLCDARAVLAIIWPDHGVRDHLGAVRHQGARCATG